MGDIVKVKNCAHEIEVMIIDFKLQNGLMVDYAGKYVKFKMDGFVLFNQKDIDSIISKENIDQPKMVHR